MMPRPRPGFVLEDWRFYSATCLHYSRYLSMPLRYCLQVGKAVAESFPKGGDVLWYSQPGGRTPSTQVLMPYNTYMGFVDVEIHRNRAAFLLVT